MGMIFNPSESAKLRPVVIGRICEFWPIGPHRGTIPGDPQAGSLRDKTPSAVGPALAPGRAWVDIPGDLQAGALRDKTPSAVGPALAPGRAWVDIPGDLQAGALRDKTPSAVGPALAPCRIFPPPNGRRRR